MKKLEFIDSLRGIAIFVVILYHSSLYGPSNFSKLFNQIISQGARGVQLFYLVSAFTIFLSYKNRFGIEKSPIKYFFIRRFFRIAPMYYLAIIYYLFQDGLVAKLFLGDQNHITFFNIFSHFTFTNGFNPYWINSIVPGGWSIGVEMIFYGVIPLLFLKIRNLNQAFVFLNLTLLITLFCHVIFYNLPLIKSQTLLEGYLYFYFPAQLSIFAMGIFLYFILIEKERLTSISGKWLFIFCVFAFAQLAIRRNFIFQNHIQFGLVFVIFAIALSRYSFTLFCNAFFIFLGKISFSMYLVHNAVLHWLVYFRMLRYTQNDYVDFVIIFTITLFCSMIISRILYLLIEVPFQNMGKKLIQKIDDRNSSNSLI